MVQREREREQGGKKRKQNEKEKNSLIRFIFCSIHLFKFLQKKHRSAASTESGAEGRRRRELQRQQRRRRRQLGRLWLPRSLHLLVLLLLCKALLVPLPPGEAAPARKVPRQAAPRLAAHARESRRVARVARQRRVEGGSAGNDLLGPGAARRLGEVLRDRRAAVGLDRQGPGPAGLDADQVYRRGGEVNNECCERER